MDEINRAGTANTGNRYSKQSYSITSLKVIFVKITTWFNLIGVSL
jgi:hypothetical protein